MCYRVLKIVQQFLAENNLKKSLKALQEETNVVDNTIDDLEAFKTDVITGRWDRVLKVTLNLSLPDSKLADLYEQVNNCYPLLAITYLSHASQSFWI